ncbi:hypothetical protein QTP70_006410 [Hemibagrus guttatus]|uniref:Uncharacterized protein n=1 Tax=Hemibagrus guttatus TaxID=175788 RepID=A0AAE0RC31_9TELE|nr:hypothetical protein QTP70_006410 [Hemibagrus guttatus]KAK3571555.1 hypothetical protein QTP86_013184 [Hemibagrus guttatus]
MRRRIKKEEEEEEEEEEDEEEEEEEEEREESCVLEQNFRAKGEGGEKVDEVVHENTIDSLRAETQCVKGVLESVEQHGNGLLPTWMVAHIRYHGFCSDLGMSGGHFILDDCPSAETQSQQNRAADNSRPRPQAMPTTYLSLTIVIVDKSFDQVRTAVDPEPMLRTLEKRYFASRWKCAAFLKPARTRK